MIRSILLLAGTAALGACATVATFTIENRLQELGLSKTHASCMADELDNRLNDADLSEFARFTVTLSKRESPLALLDSLKSIQNENVTKAVGASGLVCILRNL